MHIIRGGLEIKGGVPIIGGTAMDFTQSAILVGSESGLVLRCSHNNTIKPFIPARPIRWEHSAADIINRLPSHIQPKLCKHVGDWAEGARKQAINARDVFASKPKLHHIFPSSCGPTTEYEPHVWSLSKERYEFQQFST